MRGVFHQPATWFWGGPQYSKHLQVSAVQHLGDTVEDDGVDDGLVGADPVLDLRWRIRPVGPVVLGLELDSASPDPESHNTPDPVLGT